MGVYNQLDSMIELGVFVTIKNYHMFIELAKRCFQLGWTTDCEVKKNTVEYRAILDKAYSQLGRFDVDKKDALLWFLSWKQFTSRFDSELWDFALFFIDNNIESPELRPPEDYKSICKDELLNQ